MRTSVWQLWILAASAALSLGGECTANTYGTLNQAQFLPMHQQCEPDGYEYAVPMYAAGDAEDDIEVRMVTHGCSHASYQTIRSTHPEVATLTAIPNGVHIKTGTAGTTDLQLLDEQGQIVDTTPIVVSEIFRYDLPYNGDAVIVENVPMWVFYNTYDGNKTSLMDSGATQTTVSGSITMLPSDPPACSPAKLVGSVGMGTLRISNGSILGGMGVEVVNINKVASIALQANKPSDRGRVSVYATAKLADGRSVSGVDCQWTANDPAVTLPKANTSPRVVYFDGRGPTYVPLIAGEFQLSQHGAFVVSCTVGAISANATINW